MLEYGLDTMTLDQLTPGSQGVIVQVGNTADRVMKRRLADMGLTPGTRVTVEGAAPLGDPLKLSLRGYSLSLRREDARQILLSPPGQAAAYPPYQPQEVTHDPAPEQEAGKARRRFSLDRLRIGLAGNPNSGKTTLFNVLTGSNQYVGNWPGVTVEKAEGVAAVGRRKVTIVDLPGIYSLSPYSAEELVARRFLVEEDPDVIINIVDATNLERNLYLTTQLLELGLPMVIALNFMDQVHRRGDVIDCDLLARQLGVPVVPIAARSGTNVKFLLEQAVRQAAQGPAHLPGFLFPGDLGSLHRNIRNLITPHARAAGLSPFWAASRLIEGDRPLVKALNLDGKTVREAERLVADYEHTHRLGDRETFLADSRYRFIQWLTGQAVTRRRVSRRPSVTRRIDAVVTHPVLAYPIFLLAMLGVFWVTFGPPGAFLSHKAEELIHPLSRALRWALEERGTAPWLVGLVVDGMLRGVGSILTFLPQIALLFVFLSLLEDSGYMARAAYVMDGPLRRFGLSGKAFIPLLMGFGCSVPALMGARTLEQEQYRRMTMLLVPFMSCSARLPVYGLLTAAFFPRHGTLVVFGLYILGILFAALSGILLRRTLFRGKSAPFVLELPPYRLPALKNCALHVWERVSGFLYRAGTIILLMSVLLWALQSLGPGFQLVDDPAQSVLGALGSLLAPALKPLGFGTWQAAVALLSGLIAKEAVVSSMSLLYGFSPGDTGAAVALALSGAFPSPAAALSFLVFVLLYVPCMAALATLYREMNSLGWTLFSIAWQLAAAYGGAFVVYRLACLF